MAACEKTAAADSRLAQQAQNHWDLQAPAQARMVTLREAVAALPGSNNQDAVCRMRTSEAAQSVQAYEAKPVQLPERAASLMQHKAKEETDNASPDPVAAPSWKAGAAVLAPRRWAWKWQGSAPPK